MHASLFFKSLKDEKEGRQQVRSSLPNIKSRELNLSAHKSKAASKTSAREMEPYIKEALHHFQNKKENKIDYYDIPVDLQSHKDHHKFKSLHFINGTNNVTIDFSIVHFSVAKLSENYQHVLREDRAR
jgi:hypothetical protein